MRTVPEKGGDGERVAFSGCLQTVLDGALAPQPPANEAFEFSKPAREPLPTYKRRLYALKVIQKPSHFSKAIREPIIFFKRCERILVPSNRVISSRGGIFGACTYKVFKAMVGLF